MLLDQIKTKNFRNFTELSYFCHPRFNVFLGNNGQGKTSIIEAIYFVSTLRSFRLSKLNSLVKDTETACLVTAKTSTSEGWHSELSVRIERQGDRIKKQALINGKPYPSSVQYLSQRFGNAELGMHSIVFNPADHELVHGEPASRRTYLDRVLSAESLDYLKALQTYQKFLQQKNFALKAQFVDSRMIDSLNEGMVGPGALIVFERMNWIASVQEPIASVLSFIAPNQKQTLLEYQTKLFDTQETGLFSGQRPIASLKQTEALFRDKLVDYSTEERNARSCIVGPHRDDWRVNLDGSSIKNIGSQGEVRSFLMALKLAELQLFREKTGHRPLFLLDDYSSELDRHRRGFLLKYLLDSDLQVFLTSTDESVFEELTDSKQVIVVNGQITEKERL